MRKEEVKNLAEFVTHVEVFSLLTDLVVFRGQPISGGLLPSIARDNPTKDTKKIEQCLLEQFSLLGAGLIPVPEPRPLELLVLAQHFGLKTRLLDWTSNPLAALWFACADTRPGDAYVYALEAHDLQISDVYRKDPFSQENTRVFQPRLNNPRILAQHGWFTLHCYSAKSGKFVALEFNSDIKGRLWEFKIAEEVRSEILQSLDRHGMSRQTLFPDLEGLSKHLNWKYCLK